MWLGLTSPIMKLNDIKWFLNASSTENIIELETPLIDYMYYAFNIYDLAPSYDIPIYFIQGSNDFITPTDMVQDYFDELKCIKKEIVIQQDGGHTPFLDDPETFADTVLDLLN